MKRILAALLLLALAACAPVTSPSSSPSSSVVVEPSSAAPPAQDTLPAPDLANRVVKVLPASAHVTGLPYPSSCTAGRGANSKALPDAGCTPGAATALITQANIGQTICNPSWSTRIIRAPQSETSVVKRASMKAYGEAANTSGTTELDHLVSLELGGSNDVSNLWAEPSDIPGAGFRNTKDDVENALHAAVCTVVKPRTTRLALADAQTWIAADWTTALHKAGLN